MGPNIFFNVPDGGCWGWLQELATQDFEVPAATSLQWSLPPGLVAVDRFESHCLLTVRYQLGGTPMPPLAFGLLPIKKDEVLFAGRLNGLGQASFPQPAEAASFRLHFTPYVRTDLDVEVLHKLRDRRAAAQLQTAEEDEDLSGKVRWLAARALLLREPVSISTPTRQVLRYIDERDDWPLSKRKTHYRQGLSVFEQSLSTAAGPQQEADLAGTLQEPFGVLFTAVSDSVVRWSLGNSRLREAPSPRLRLLTDPNVPVTEAVTLAAGGIVIVDGSKLETNGAVAFLVTPDDDFNEETAEVFVVRRADGVATGFTPEELSERQLFVDAWQAKAAAGGPTEELCEFLSLFIVAPMMAAFDDFDRDCLQDRYRDVRSRWRDFRDRLAPFRNVLLKQCIPSGEESSSSSRADEPDGSS